MRWGDLGMVISGTIISFHGNAPFFQIFEVAFQITRYLCQYVRQQGHEICKLWVICSGALVVVTAMIQNALPIIFAKCFYRVPVIVIM